MDDGSEEMLRRRAVELRRTQARAAEQGDAWALAGVDLEDLERSARRRGFDLSSEAGSGGSAYC
ncbi:hypothetical protein [Kitasatospora sp. NPDC056531]|uniref:hypothetical protein n=1 Tax=Kitasatospora sp. NPDC056531 TaxID=3345856 RepID=UPI003690AD60